MASDEEHEEDSEARTAGESLTARKAASPKGAEQEAEHNNRSLLEVNEDFDDESAEVLSREGNF